MPQLPKLPSIEVALTDYLAAGKALSDAIEQRFVDQIEADDTLDALINSKIGSPNELTGKNHSYTSAESWAKSTSDWRDKRELVIKDEAHIESCRTKHVYAELVARLATAKTEALYKTAKVAA
jgi:hypothetical protein